MSKLQTVKIIATLFSAYGQAQDGNRIAIYTEMLEDVPPAVLQAVCKKIILQNKFLPAVSEIIEAAHSLIGDNDEQSRVKTWAEAQREIQQGLSRAWFKGCMNEIPQTHEDYGKPCAPMWTTPEIAEAVNSYGFENIGQSLVSDMPIVWAQLRKLYEAACQRKKDKEINERVLCEFKLIGANVKRIK